MLLTATWWPRWRIVRPTDRCSRFHECFYRQLALSPISWPSSIRGTAMIDWEFPARTTNCGERCCATMRRVVEANFLTTRRQRKVPEKPHVTRLPPLLSSKAPRIMKLFWAEEVASVAAVLVRFELSPHSNYSQRGV